ncbi:isochorismatase family protein [Paralcaligenes sp. KSB-10]|jgi:nicotinamidase-related amidase|uniref:isochorismatase family protein n=1 Tax=Paralcaligenes sp. KSB-10 TaxID=2901142 RepID=UPI001E59EA3A|nr:isochorismatase family protein [Paralcaligenes sp. KSB-10]UHL62529.1 isochorismatase family protein [Paralcaligenes sp. KSB-10]
MRQLRAEDSVLVVVDMQTRLLPAIHDCMQLLARAQALAGAARLLDIPVIATEHCAAKIGPTATDLRPFLHHIVHKMHFNAASEPGFVEQLPGKRSRVLLIGTEAHVCVLQTALGLMDLGLCPVLVADCIGSRRQSDRHIALARAAHYGIEVVSAEMAMFEWLESAHHPRFKEVLALIKSCNTRPMPEGP